MNKQCKTAYNSGVKKKKDVWDLKAIKKQRERERVD